MCRAMGHGWAGSYSRYSDWLWAGQSGDRMPVGARFSTPVQTGPRAHPASCTMHTGSFLGVKGGRGMTLTLHPLLVPQSRKGRAIPLLPLWAVWPVQSLSAGTGVHFTFFTYGPCRGRREIHTGFWWGNMKERTTLKTPRCGWENNVIGCPKPVPCSMGIQSVVLLNRNVMVREK